MKRRKVIRAECVLLSFIMALMFAGCSEINLRQEEDSPFDFYIDLTTKDDIDGLSSESFVKGVFSFTLMTFQRPGYSNSSAGQIALLVAPSFENLDVSPFNRENLIKEDVDVMRDKEKNPILISNDLARSEKLSVGDVFYQETRISEEPLSFTVAGIYRHESLFAQFDAVALINSQIYAVFSDTVDELGYTNAYIKATDLTALKKYLDEDFIPHLQLKGLSEEEIASIPQEELKAYYEEYTAHMNRMK